MSAPIDNEIWIIDAGDAVIQKKACSGMSGLSSAERLVYCLWVADYSMRNAGDLDTALDLYPFFQQEAAQFAGELFLAFTYETFLLPQGALQKQYFERFDRICNEIKNA